MVPKSLPVRSYATPENWPNFYQLSYQATGKQSLTWSPVKEKVSVVRFQIDAYKISTKHKGKDGKDIMQSQISVHEFSGGILCDRRE